MTFDHFRSSTLLQSLVILSSYSSLRGWNWLFILIHLVTIQYLIILFVLILNRPRIDCDVDMEETSRLTVNTDGSNWQVDKLIEMNIITIIDDGFITPNSLYIERDYMIGKRMRWSCNQSILWSIIRQIRSCSRRSIIWYSYLPQRVRSVFLCTLHLKQN